MLTSPWTKGYVVVVVFVRVVVVVVVFVVIIVVIDVVVATTPAGKLSLRDDFLAEKGVSVIA